MLVYHHTAVCPELVVADVVAAAVQLPVFAVVAYAHGFARFVVAEMADPAGVTRLVHSDPECVDHLGRAVRLRLVLMGPFARSRQRAKSAHSIREEQI